jgi:hypothetical protein
MNENKKCNGCYSNWDEQYVGSAYIEIEKHLKQFEIQMEERDKLIQQFTNLWFEKFQSMKIQDFTCIIANYVDSLNCGAMFSVLTSHEIGKRQMEERRKNNNEL